MRHIDHGIRVMITPYLRTRVLIIEDGARHAKVRSPHTQDFLPITGTPSDASMRSQLSSRRAAPHRMR